MDKNIKMLEKTINFKEFSGFFSDKPDAKQNQLDNYFWYSSGNQNKFLIYKTGESVGFGRNTIGKWVDTNIGWSYSFKSSPNSWQVMLDDDVKWFLNVEAKRRYKANDIITQKTLDGQVGLPIKLDGPMKVTMESEPREGGGENWLVFIGNRMVFNTNVGEWAKVIPETNLKVGGWYGTADGGSIIQITNISNYSIEGHFFEDGKYTHKHSINSIILPTNYVSLNTKHNIYKVFKKYALENYEGRCWVTQGGETISLIETTQDNIDVGIDNDLVRVYSNNVVIYNKNGWVKKHHIQPPSLGNYDMVIGDGVVIFNGYELPFSLFQLESYVSIKKIVIDDDLVMEPKLMEHIKMYLMTYNHI